METGAAVWLRDSHGDKAWLECTIHSKEIVDGRVVIITRNEETGAETTFSFNDDAQELEDVKLRNDPIECEVDDLINLPYLHEPAILYCLEKRYEDGNIYTYTGPILIAMNPFKRVPLYTSQILESYYNFGLLKSQGIDNALPLAPHVYAIADAAYRDMMKSILHSGFASSAKGNAPNQVSANQCILISGESGAGKTESTKIVLRYLTTVGNSSSCVELESGSVMEKVLKSNPILEAFGNARTLRNDNSSRFGKFIELNFNKRGHLVGGLIRTYLLEKVRLPTQQLGERNFHIFYQMAAGASEEEKLDWQLLPIDQSWYTSQGDIFELRHVNDVDEYHAMRTAMNTLNFDVNDQASLLNIMAGLLHLGQIQFIASADGEGCDVMDDADVQFSLAAVSRLFGLATEELIRALTIRAIKVMNEVMMKRLSPVQAADARDALAKAVYGRLFDWIVQTINLSIEVDKASVRADIGVLDIFGFECFKQNSFEQLCINYTNETLQQQFNQFVFKMEQLEYQRENIIWSFIEFPDNQDCLDLIENKQKGILAMLDDECRLPGASDEKLASRLYKALESHNRFSATKANKRDSQFCINHYAGPVVYSAHTFVEKNKDELPKEADALLQLSSVNLLASIFSGTDVETPTKATGKEPIRKAAGGRPGGTNSVGAQFKEQLSALMTKIYSTAPHYIRCLKPNDDNVSDNFNRRRTTEQLRYGGVLEAVRVARSGFPVRLSHIDFFARYRLLANPFNAMTARLPHQIHGLATAPACEMCQKLISTLWDDSMPGFDDMAGKTLASVKSSRHRSRVLDLNIWKGKVKVPEESLQLGKTKVFLRKQAHDLLEARRSRRVSSAACKMQSIYRGWLSRRWFLMVAWAVRVIQRLGRGLIARGMARNLRHQRAAKLLQTATRRHICRRKYTKFVIAVVKLQNLFRSKGARAQLNTMKFLRNITRLQRLVRGLTNRKKYLRLRKYFVALQCLVRRFVARRKLRGLRIAARDVGSLRQSNEALKAEIEMLRAKAAEEAKRLSELAYAAEQQQRDHALDDLAALKAEFEKEKERRIAAEAKAEEALKIIAAKEIEIQNANEKIRSDEILLKSMEASLVSSQSSLSQALVNVAKYEAEIHSLRRRSGNVMPSSNEDNDMTIVLSEALAEAQQETRDLTEKMKILEYELALSKANFITTGADKKVSNENTMEALTRERCLREQMEDEITVLRGQIDNLKLQQRSNGQAVLTVPSRRPDAEPRRRSQVQNSAILSVRSSDSSENGAMKKKKVVGSSQQKGMSEKAPFEGEEDNTIMNSDGDPMTKSVNANVSPFSDRSQRVANKSIKPSMKSGPMPSVNPLLTSSPASVSQHTALQTFERNVSSFRDKLRHGVKACVWEGQRVVSVEVLLKLDNKNENLVFEQPSKRFTISYSMIFSSRPDIASIRIADIYECIPGAEVSEHTSDNNRLITLVTRNTQAPRILAIQLISKEDRNFILTGLRTLVAEFMNSVGSNAAPESSNTTIPPSPSLVSGQNPALVGAKADSSTRTRLSNAATPSSLSQDVDDNARDNSASAAAFNEMKRQLAAERANHERMMMQVVMLTNDLTDRDLQIENLLKREASLNAAIAQKDRMYEQDAAMRLQLGKRLEQVLVDKEEITEQYEAMKDQMNAIRLSLESVMGGAGVFPVAGSIATASGRSSINMTPNRR